MVEGVSGLNFLIASSTINSISLPPFTRFQVMSTPSKTSLSAFSPNLCTKYSGLAPRPRGTPKPCDLCCERLSAAISLYDFPKKGLYTPIST